MRAASILCLMWLPLAAALAENPPDVTFSIATKNGRTTFQMGEAVDVQFSFRSTAPGKYRLITAPDDRTVRIPRYDQFIVEPREGVADPLGDIPAQIDGMLVKGSLQQWPLLSSNAAAIVEQPVNLWVSFRKPGKYRITAETKRVVTAGQPSAPLPLRSNSIEVEIVEPEPGWRAAQLSAAVATLARGDPRVVMGQPYDERGTANLRQAGRIVRFLETVEAVPVLARLFEDGPRNAQGDIRAGLFGSPYRKQVITAMEQAVESPDRPVTYSYLAALMELVATETFGPQPSHPADDPAAEKSWMEAHRRYLDQSKPVETHYFDMLANAIPRKQGRALAVSLETLLTRGPQPPSPSTLALLMQSFQALPDMDQRGLLTVDWFRLASPAVEPFVRSLAEGTGLVRDAALLRLLDFNPAAARKVAIERIRRCDTGGGVNDDMRALLSLPDKTLPELDNALIEALEQGKPAEVLVARYATDAILSRVRAWYEQGPKPRGRPLCGGPIFAYFFRVDPAYAADRLASSRRSGDACPLYMPQDEDLLMSPGLERAAINDLANPSTTVQRGAETILEKGGSRDAEQPLWEGLARSRETGGGTPGWEAEFGFMDALINGNGWALTPEKLDRIAVGCVSAGCRSLVTSLRRVVEPPIQISFSEVACGSCPIRVGSSRAGSLKKLEDKISQFPRGTQFRVYPFRRGTWFGDQLTSQVRSIVQAAGMTLEETPAMR